MASAGCPRGRLARLLPPRRRTPRASARGAATRTPRRALASELGRGEGGDTTLAVDRAAEDAVFAELEALGVPLMAVSEERGEVAIGGGGPAAWW